MRFKTWFKNEEMTHTGNVAHFQNRLGAGDINSRWWLSNWEKELMGKKPKKKKFVYQLPQVQEFKKNNYFI
jgi:hypothetical protein